MCIVVPVALIEGASFPSSPIGLCFRGVLCVGGSQIINGFTPVNLISERISFDPVSDYSLRNNAVSFTLKT